MVDNERVASDKATEAPSAEPRRSALNRRNFLGLLALGGAVYGVQSAVSAATSHPAPSLPQVPLTGTIPIDTDADSMLAFSQDGGRLAVSMWNTVTLCDMTTRRSLGPLTDPLPQVATGLVFSPDGSLIVANTHPAKAGADIARWDVTTRRTLAEAHGAVPDILAMALRPDGGLLASIDSNTGSTTLWSMPDLSVVGSLPHEAKLNVHIRRGMAFSPDGAHLLLPGGKKATATIWDLATRQPVGTLSGENGVEGTWASYTPNGRWVVVGNADKTEYNEMSAAYLFDASTGGVLDLLPDDRHQDGAVQSVPVAVSPNGRLAAYNLSTLKDDDSRALALYDLASGTQVAVADGPPTSCLAFSPDGHTLIGGGFHTSPANPGLRLWDVSRWLNAPMPTKTPSFGP